MLAHPFSSTVIDREACVKLNIAIIALITHKRLIIQLILWNVRSASWALELSKNLSLAIKPDETKDKD
jgi:hypothetical protein